ncbi:MAG: YdcF family protein [Treponema sp.]|nr:YdcF family protein [Treponema sp.]
MGKRLKFLAIAVGLSFFAIGIFCISINVYMVSYAKPYIYSDVDSLPYKYAAILPGAKVYRNSVSHVVRDRVEGSLQCLNSGKVERILVSGDHGRTGYDEVNQIRRFMQGEYGTDGSLIFMDHAGFSTYETMYRARDIFCVKDAVIVTQKFHVYRAVYIARKLGLDAVAFVAPEMVSYSRELHHAWEFREFLARVKAFFSVALNVKPTYLGEQIPITGDSGKSWD